MDKIRLASSQEIEKLAPTADIIPGATVVAFENADKTPDFAVFRPVFEMDPVIFAPETGDRRKAFFVWSLENALRLQGNVPAYYFNVHASDEKWVKAVESWGATKTSTAPEFRFKKVL